MSQSYEHSCKRVTLSHSGYALLFLFFLGVVQFLLQMRILTRGMSFIVSHLTIDDTYYYLQTAWNIKNLGFPTFDGIHSTNGVQLLWFGIMTFFAVIVQTKAELVLAVLTACFLLNVLSYFAIWKLGETLKRPALAMLMASLWSMQSFAVRAYSTGMENSLHAFVFWCAVLQVAVFVMRVKRNEHPSLVGLTVALILNAWARLDSSLFSVVLYIFCVSALARSAGGFWPFWQRDARNVVVSAALAGFGMVVQLAVFWEMGGSFLPVSALVKSSGQIGAFGAGSPERLANAFVLSVPEVLPSAFPPITSGLLGLIGVLTAMLSQFVRSRSHGVELAAFRTLWLCLLIAFVVYHIALVGSGTAYGPYNVWYRSPLFIFWIVTFSLAGDTIVRVLAGGTYANGSKWALVGLTFLIIAASVLRFAVRIRIASNTLPGRNLYSIRYRAALWISDNSSPDTVYAAWNAGQLGYFSNRTVINLDGLINSVDYYERVLQGTVPLIHYLYENGVDYVVDYHIADELSLLGLPVVKAFPHVQPSGPWIRIWRIPAQSP